MTTRINIRNISRKNLNIELRPRNDGTVTFIGEPPKNAVLENGGAKFTLATQKVDRGGVVVDTDVSKCELYINTINNVQIGKTLLAWWDSYYEFNNWIHDYSLAQMGIGINWNWRNYNPTRKDFDDAALVLVNNTNEPKVINGVVLNLDTYSPGSVTDPENPNTYIAGPGMTGEYIPPQSGTLATGISSLTHVMDYQDPGINNPTSVREDGSWGIVLGSREHRVGTHLKWTFKLPAVESSITTAVLYLPYTYTNKDHVEVEQQAMYVLTRTAGQEWFNGSPEFFDNLSAAFSQLMLGNADRIIATDQTYANEFTIKFWGYEWWISTDNLPGGVIQSNNTGVNIYSNTNPSYVPATGLTGNEISFSIAGLPYIGIANDGTDITVNPNDPEAPEVYYSDSKILLKPNAPCYTADTFDESTTVFINIARNEKDKDLLGYVGENCNNFIVNSSGINNAMVWYNEDGSEYVVEPPPPVIPEPM